MRYTISVFIFFCMLICRQSHAQGWSWAAGGSCPFNAIGFIEGWPVAVDNKGNSFIAAWAASEPSSSYGSNVVPNPGSPEQLAIAKADSGGHFLWAKGTISTSSFPLSIATDTTGNLYVLGTYQGAECIFDADTLHNSSGMVMCFMMKLDPLGSVVWMKNIAGYSGGLTSYPTAGALALDKAGNIFVTGPYTGGVTIGPVTLPAFGAIDIFIAKYDNNGNPIWAEGFGGGGNEWANGIRIANNGNIYIDGIFFSPTAAFDTAVLANPDLYSSFFIKMDKEGHLRWAKKYWSYTIGNYLGEFVIDDQENIYATGGYSDPVFHYGTATLYNANPTTQDVYIVKCDSNGNVVWAKSGNGNAYEAGNGICIDACGFLWVCGPCFDSDDHVLSFDGHPLYAPPGSKDPMFIARFDKSGNYVSGFTLPTGGDDQSVIVADDKNYVYLGGDYYIPDFPIGHDTLHQQILQENVFLARYNYAVFDTLTTTTNLTICGDSAIILHAPDGYDTRIWNSGSTAFADTLHSDSTVWVRSVKVCNGSVVRTDVYNVHYIAPIDTVIMNTDTIFCVADSFMLTAPAGFTSYQWNDGPITAQRFAHGPGKWFVTCTSPCISDTVLIDTFHVVYKVPADTVFFTSDSVLCHGGRLYLDGPPGYAHYLWENGNSSHANFVTAPGTYRLASWSSCTDTALRMDIFHVAYPVISDTIYQATDTVLCRKNAIVLNAPARYMTYRWNDGSTAVTSTVQTAGQYWVMCTPYCAGPLLIDTFKVADLPPGLPFPLAADTFACSPIQLHVPANGLLYKWQDGSTGYTYNVASSGMYYCTASVSGCAYTQGIVVTIPDLAINLVDTIVCRAALPAMLTATLPPGAKCLWSNGGVEATTQATYQGKYWVTVTDSICSVSDTMLLQVDYCDLVIHDCLTPNGDGVNDTWIIESIQRYPGNEVLVFDKWGDEVYQQRNYNNDWGGRSKKGTDIPDGTYFYFVKVNDPKNPADKKVFEGALLLKR